MPGERPALARARPSLAARERPLAYIASLAGAADTCLDYGAAPPRDSCCFQDGACILSASGWASVADFPARFSSTRSFPSFKSEPAFCASSSAVSLSCCSPGGFPLSSTFGQRAGRWPAFRKPSTPSQPRTIPFATDPPTLVEDGPALVSSFFSVLRQSHFVLTQLDEQLRVRAPLFRCLRQTKSPHPSGRSSP